MEEVKAPLISIITICYNAEELISKTIESVLCQNFRNYEYIIIDGGSKDETKFIVESYKKKFIELNTSFVFSSEKDRGISDAFNKGIALSTGKYIVMLNAGDTWINADVLQRVALKLTGAVVTFRYQMGRYVSKRIDPYAVLQKRAMVNHQATFVDRKVYKAEGTYNLKYKIRMDYDFFLRILSQWPLLSYEDVIVLYDAGVSDKLSTRVRYETEGVLAEYFNLQKGFIFVSLIGPKVLYRIVLYLLRTIVKKVRKVY